MRVPARARSSRGVADRHPDRRRDRLIFLAVVHRYGTGLSIDLSKWADAHGIPVLAAIARDIYTWFASLGCLVGAGTLHLHVHLDGEVRRRLWRAHRHPCRRRCAGQPARRREAQGRDPVRARCAARSSPSSSRSFGADASCCQMCETGQQSNDLEAPMWIVYLAIPLGCSLMCFRFLQVAWCVLLDRRTAASPTRRGRGRRRRTEELHPATDAARHRAVALVHAAARWILILLARL